MPTEHPDLATLAALLAGDLDAETVRAAIVPHLAAQCPRCAEHLATIRDLSRRYDHWDESVVVREGTAAPALLDDLLTGTDQETRLALIETDDELHTWGLAQELLRACRESLFEDAHRAVELAELAVRLVEHLPGGAYHEDWLSDLRARSWAYLGNARRVVGEVRSAEADLRRAFSFLRRRGTGRPVVEAELRDLLASLRLCQGRFDEALNELATAARLYREDEDDDAPTRARRLARTRLKHAKILEEQGCIDEAVAVLETVPEGLDPEGETRLLLFARANLAYCLAEARRPERAQELLTDIRLCFAEVLTAADHARLGWIEGRVAEQRGDRRRAETLFSEAQRFYLDHRIDLDAALVSLELAVLYAADGRTEELRALSESLLPLFSSRDLHREVLSVLHLWRHAVDTEALSHRTARELATVIRRRPVSL